jgi:hypothetical protein
MHGSSNVKFMTTRKFILETFLNANIRNVLISVMTILVGNTEFCTSKNGWNPIYNICVLCKKW